MNSARAGAPRRASGEVAVPGGHARRGGRRATLRDGQATGPSPRRAGGSGATGLEAARAWSRSGPAQHGEQHHPRLVPVAAHGALGQPRARRQSRSRYSRRSSASPPPGPGAARPARSGVERLVHVEHLLLRSPAGSRRDGGVERQLGCTSRCRGVCLALAHGIDDDRTHHARGVRETRHADRPERSWPLFTNFRYDSWTSAVVSRQTLRPPSRRRERASSQLVVGRGEQPVASSRSGRRSPGGSTR